MRRYFTVRDPSAADKAAVSSFFAGVDLSGVEYMSAKLLSGVPEPAWDGTAIELTEEEANAASESPLYGPQAGPKYRALSVAFGQDLFDGFVNATTNTLPATVLAPLLAYLVDAAAAATYGYITTLRQGLLDKPVSPDDPAAPAPYTAATRDQLIAQIDAFLDKFPGNAGRF